MHGVRDLACGLLAGALLAVARAPVGIDLLEVPLPSLRARLAFRAGALLALAAALGLGPRRALRPVALLGGAALGFTLAGLAWPAAWLPSALGELLLLFLVLSGATHLLARRAGTVKLAETGAETGEPSAAPLELAGIALAGAAAARSLEAAASSLRLLGGGTGADDAAAAVALLALAALGAAALGTLLRRALRGRGAAGFALALAVAAAISAERESASLADPEALAAALSRPARALAHLGLSIEPMRAGARGTLGYAALLAGELLLPAAFALGLAVALSRDRRRLAAALAGSGAGLALPLAAPSPPLSAYAAAVLALAGAACSVRRRAGGAALAFGLAAALLALRASGGVRSPPESSPAEPSEAAAEMLAQTQDGLAAIELEPGGEPVATLHGRRLTPSADELAHDARRIELSLGLLADDVRARGPRVLLVGQMTADRAAALARAGARADRAAPWPAASEALEDALFPGEFRPAGEALEPDEARARLAAGAYDLVLVPPISGPLLPGPSPLAAEWAAADPLSVLPPAPPAGTIAVIWQDARAPLAGAPLGDGVLLSVSPDLCRISAGVVLGALGHPWLLPPGRRRAEPPARLLEPPALRTFARGRELGARLLDAARGTPREELARGLALHLSAQRPSAPFDSPLASVEIDPAAVAALRADALAREPDPAARDLFEALAAVLVEKRLPELLAGDVAAVADARAPWPALDRAVARGWEELLEPDRAQTYLERAEAAEAAGRDR